MVSGGGDALEGHDVRGELRLARTGKHRLATLCKYRQALVHLGRVELGLNTVVQDTNMQRYAGPTSLGAARLSCAWQRHASTGKHRLSTIVKLLCMNRNLNPFEVIKSPSYRHALACLAPALDVSGEVH